MPTIFIGVLLKQLNTSGIDPALHALLHRALVAITDLRRGITSSPMPGGGNAG
jgi:hypothetical protein